MGKMSTMAIISRGSPKQLQQFVDQAAEVKGALLKGLKEVVVSVDVTDPTRVEVASYWQDLAALQSYVASQGKSASLLTGGTKVDDPNLAFEIAQPPSIFSPKL